MSEWQREKTRERVEFALTQHSLTTGLEHYINTLLPTTHGHQRTAFRDFVAALLAEMVLGVTVGGEKKAYPLDELTRSPSPFTTDTVGGTEVRIVFSSQSMFAYAGDSSGAKLPSIVTYRATWLAFYPHSQLYCSPH